MTTATLNVKISIELKEKIRHYAEENSETLASVTEKLLSKAFDELDGDVGIDEDDVDSQHTAEVRVTPLNDREIKALRKLLKKKK